LDTYSREVVLVDERSVLAFELDALASERVPFGRALEYGWITSAVGSLLAQSSGARRARAWSSGNCS
jgi:hypothetical protein